MMYFTGLRRWWAGLALVAALCVLAACGQEKLQGTRYDPVIAAPEFEGEGSNGQPFRISDLRGKVVLLFFGYTYCPDICPTTLAKMAQVYGELGDQAQDVAVVLASLDPERDAPEHLAAYVTAFHPDFLGVRIPVDRLEEVKNAYGVFSEKRVLDANESAAGYLIDHTGWVYVIDPEGNLREVFASDATPAQIAADAATLAN
jgi:protein SCO1/2